MPEGASTTLDPQIQALLRAPQAGLLVVISGPSGAGKDAVIEGLRAQGMRFYKAVTAITRAPRPGEVHGKDHYFLTQAEFAAWEAQGRFLETATVYGLRYGTPLSEVTDALARSEDVLLRVDVQGAATVRKRMPESVLVFIAPPSLEVLRQRRNRRGTTTQENEAARDAQAIREMAAIPSFDYLIVNYPDRLSAAVEQLRSIIFAEKCRVARLRTRAGQQ